MRMNSCINGVTVTNIGKMSFDPVKQQKAEEQREMNKAAIKKKQRQKFLENIGWTDPEEIEQTEPAEIETTDPEIVPEGSTGAETEPDETFPDEVFPDTGETDTPVRKRGRPRKEEQ